MERSWEGGRVEAGRSRKRHHRNARKRTDWAQAAVMALIVVEAGQSMDV